MISKEFQEELRSNFRALLSSISRAQSVRRSLRRARGFRRRFRPWTMGKALILTWLRFPLQHKDHHLLLNHLFYHHNCLGEQSRMWPLRVSIARRRIWPVTVRLTFLFENFLGSFYFWFYLVLFHSCMVVLRPEICVSPGEGCTFSGVGGRRDYCFGMNFIFLGCRFRHKSYHPRTGCRDIGVYPMGSSDNSIVGFRELIRLREVVNSLISTLLAFPLIGQRTAIVKLAVPCFIYLRSSLFAPVLPIEICQGLVWVLASHDLMQN